jgi:hypothetical protein
MIKNMKSKFSLATLAALVFPTLAFAAGKTLADIIDLIIYYLNIILVLFMGAAVVIFVYYVIKYFILPNENRSEAGSYVLYSVIGFFVILSFWGLVNVLQNTFGLQNENNKPASWASFSNLFPGGSTGGGGGNSNTPQFNGSGVRNTGGGTGSYAEPIGPAEFSGASNLQTESGIRQAEEFEAFQGSI